MTDRAADRHEFQSLGFASASVQKLLFGLAMGFLILWAVISLYPVLYLVITSFRTDAEILNRPFAVDGPFTVDNYWQVITGGRTSMSVMRYLLNSVIVTAGTLTVLLLVSSLAGYALARGNFPLKAHTQQLILLFLAVPVHVLIIPIYTLFGRLGLRDNLLGVIVLYSTIGLPLTILLMRSYFVSFPKEIEEAAAIDGLSKFGTFFRIVLPISKGPIASMAIVNLGWVWSELFFALTLLGKLDTRTIPLAIAAYRPDSMASDSVIGQLFAIMTLSVVPVLIVYLLFQRQIQKGMTAGAVK
jgi:raffinose/stachyose/melibiose transport system permease protein